jgi:PIN domain nuclease of toxin-antitoxin system
VRLLLDTHILVWLVLNDRRLTARQRHALEDPDNAMVVSPVVAYELTHLQRMRRIPLSEPIDRLQELAGFDLDDLPNASWRWAAELPDIHRDPIDRLLVSHALCEGMAVVTADKHIRRYPVDCI